MRIVAWIELVYNCLSIVGSFRAILIGSYFSIISVIIMVLAALCVGRLLTAAHNTTASATIPYIVYKSVHLALMAFGIGYLAVWINSGESGNGFRDILIGLLVFVCFYVVCSLLFLCIVLQG